MMLPLPSGYSVGKLPGLITGALLLAVVGSECEGAERLAQTENGHLHVSFEQGFVAVSAEAVEFRAVLRGIAAQSRIEIILVNPPSGPVRVTLAVDRQPVERAIRTVLQTIPLSGPAPPSYSFAYAGDELQSVRVFFPASGRVSAARSGRTSENLGAPESTGVPDSAEPTMSKGWPETGVPQETHAIALEPGRTWGRPLTAMERRQLIDELAAAGIPTETLDDGQLSGIRRLKEMGLSLPEIRAALPEPPSAMGSPASDSAASGAVR